MLIPSTLPLLHPQRRLASQQRASLPNPLTLLPLIAHPRKRLLKIAPSQGCTFCKVLDQWAHSSPCSQVAGVLEARNSFLLLFPPPTSGFLKKKSFHRSLSPRTPAVARGLDADPCQIQQCAVVAAELPTLARVKGVQSRQSGARQAIFTCFPRGSTLSPLLSSCTCQVCSRHQ